MAWKVTVMGVVDLFGNTENCWLVESIEFVSGLLNVVLDTIAILISDSSLDELVNSTSGKGHQGTVGLHESLENNIIISVTFIGSAEWVLPLGFGIGLLLSNNDTIVIFTVVGFSWSLGISIERLDLYGLDVSEKGKSSDS